MIRRLAAMFVLGVAVIAMGAGVALLIPGDVGRTAVVAPTALDSDEDRLVPRAVGH